MHLYCPLMRCAAYVRVSSKSQNLESQRLAIARAAKARGDAIAEWYCEERSASTLAREQLDWLRRDVRAGKFEKLYVFRIDRLARSGIRDTLTVIDEFRAHGCQVATVADGFSLQGPGADVVLAVLAWAAQMERAALGERIAAARAKVEASGGRWGRPRVVDPGTQARMQKLRSEGRTIREISVAMKISKSVVHRAVSQIGHYSQPHPGPRKTGLAEASR